MQISKSLADAAKDGWLPSLEFPSVGLFRETTESLDATIETLTKLRGAIGR